MGHGQEQNFGTSPCQGEHLLLSLLEGAEDAALARIVLAAKARIPLGAGRRLIEGAADGDGNRDDQGAAILEGIQLRSRSSHQPWIVDSHDSYVRRAVVHDDHGRISGGREPLELLRFQAAAGCHGHVDGQEAKTSGKAGHEFTLRRVSVRSKHDSEVKELVHTDSFRRDFVGMTSWKFW